MNKSVFETLNSINVNEHTEKKGNLTYLSWAWAWAECKKAFPSASYTVYENDHGWCYFTDGKTCWVKTGVTICDQEHIEYLPIMDVRNKSIPLENVTSFDVNKAIQRSLTKALARHGLGLYIYAGEDLPEMTPEEIQAKAEEEAKAKAELIKKLNEVAGILKDKKIAVNYVTKLYKVKSLKELSMAQAENVIKHINDIEEKYKEDNKNE